MVRRKETQNRSKRLICLGFLRFDQCKHQQKNQHRRALPRLRGCWERASAPADTTRAQQQQDSRIQYGTASLANQHSTGAGRPLCLTHPPASMKARAVAPENPGMKKPALGGLCGDERCSILFGFRGPSCCASGDSLIKPCLVCRGPHHRVQTTRSFRRRLAALNLAYE